MIWINSITDRTDEDVELVKEYDLIGFTNLTEQQKSQWINGMIGALNTSDLNRIENNIAYLAGFAKITTNNKTNWAMNEIFNLENANRILTNIQLLCGRFSFSQPPNIPTIPLNEFSKINQIEKLLNQMYMASQIFVLRPNFITSDGKEILMSDREFFACWVPPEVEDENRR